MSNNGLRVPSPPGLYRWTSGTGGCWTNGRTYRYDGTRMEVDHGAPVVSSANPVNWEYMGPLEKEEQQERLIVYICDACSFGAPCYLVNEEHTGGGPPKVCAYNLQAEVNWRVNGTKE